MVNGQSVRATTPDTQQGVAGTMASLKPYASSK